MKHDKGVKIWQLSVLIMAEKQKQNRLKKHAKMRGKEGYNGRWHIETSNGDEPFNNVE